MKTQLFGQFFESASVKGARSTALQSLQWGKGLILAGIPTALIAGSPQWLMIVLASCLGIMFLTFIGSYLFLLANDRDALRSEHFSLSKMAIEKGLVGDNVTGLIEDKENVKNLIDAQVVSDEGAKQ